jgi:ankyrin repeat protein
MAEIVSLCAGLVAIDEESNIIRLVHYTTQDYFERTQKRWFPDADMDIVTTCITYLSFDAFDAGFCLTDEAFEARLREYELYDYSARNWGHHAHVFSNVAEQLILSFLEDETKLSACTQAMIALERQPWQSSNSQGVPRQMTGVHAAAYFGLTWVMISLLENGHDPKCRDTYSQTPLLLAARYGHAAVVKLLLDTSQVDVDSKDQNDQTPLSHAAENGHTTTVKLLLDTNQVNVDSNDQCNQTPLSYAALNGHVAVAKLLLDTGKVDVNSKANYHRTPLSYAAENGHVAVVKILLDYGAELESKDNYSGQTPLLWAAGNGHEEIMQILLRKGALINVTDNSGRTPVSWAAGNGNGAVVQHLLLWSADITIKDTSGRTPLSWAAKNGHGAVVSLLERSTESNVQDMTDQLPPASLENTVAIGNDIRHIRTEDPLTRVEPFNPSKTKFILCRLTL